MTSKGTLFHKLMQLLNPSIFHFPFLGISKRFNRHEWMSEVGAKVSRTRNGSCFFTRHS